MFLLSVEDARHTQAVTYEYLPFSIGHGEKGTAFVQLVMGDASKNEDPNRGFPRSAIGKTITLTVKVNGTTVFYYIRAKSIQRWIDPQNSQDKILSAYVIKDGASVPLSQKYTQPTELASTDSIVFDASSSLVGSTLAIAATLSGDECYGKYLHLEVGQNGLVYFTAKQLDVDITSDKTITILLAKQTSGSLNSECSYAPNDFDLFYIKILDAKPESLPYVSQTLSTSTAFSDMPTAHWAHPSVMQLVGKGVISGYPDGTFKPNGLVTRSEFAKMMYFALGIDKTSDYSGVIVDQPFFVDVTGDNWEYVYVKYVSRYLTGFEAADGQVYFKGSEPAVREDMAVALVKALKLEAEVAAYANADYVYAKLQEIFSDADDISPNLRKFVLVAYEQKLISGYPDGTFGAQKSITRAETAALFVKVLGSEAMKKVTFE